MIQLHSYNIYILQSTYIVIWSHGIPHKKIHGRVIWYDSHADQPFCSIHSIQKCQNLDFKNTRIKENYSWNYFFILIKYSLYVIFANLKSSSNCWKFGWFWKYVWQLLFFNFANFPTTRCHELHGLTKSRQMGDITC